MAKICKICGSVGAPKMDKRGTASLEFLLWLCFLVPGFLYSIWRLMTRFQTCSNCGSTKVTEFEPSRSLDAHHKPGNVEKQAKR
jgi:hypothetical protein